MDTVRHWEHARSLDDYVSEMWRKNRKVFARNRERTVIDPAIRERYIQRPLKILVLTEHYCEDSTQLLPVVWRLEDEVETVETRVLCQHQHPDLASQYLNAAGHPAIPVFILLNEHLREIGALVERPRRVTAEMTDEIRRFQQTHPDLPGINRTMDRMPEETRAIVKGHIATWRDDQHDRWANYLLDDLARIVGSA